MPVKLLWNVGLVVYIDRDTLAFFEAEKRTRKLAVVGSYRHDVLWSQFDWLGRDGQSVVGWRNRVGQALRATRRRTTAGAEPRLPLRHPLLQETYVGKSPLRPFVLPLAYRG
jgi:hypothetical protein